MAKPNLKTSVGDVALVPTRNAEMKAGSPLSEPKALLGDIKAMIEAARQRAASAINSGLTMLYWRIGQRIHVQVLDERRADYGVGVLQNLAAQLVKAYGGSFAVKNLRRMVQFAVTFPDEKIVVSLIRQLSWTHFIALIPLKGALQRDFYAQMACADRWSVRTLRERIGSMLYERTALSRKPDSLIAQELESLRNAQRMSPALVMRDPTSWTSLTFVTPGRKPTWRRPSSVKWNPSCWSWGRLCLCRPAKRIQIDDEDFTLTSCSTTASCAGWWRLS